jgi:hypothetical protein
MLRQNNLTFINKDTEGPIVTFVRNNAEQLKTMMLVMRIEFRKLVELFNSQSVNNNLCT